MWEKVSLCLCLYPHSWLIQHIGFTYLQMNYTLRDFSLWIQAHPSGTHRPRLSTWQIWKHLTEACLVSPELVSTILSCGTELPSTLGPLPWNCCHLTCPSSIWSPSLGPALHMWRLYSILVTVRRIINVLQWKINQGRVTQLQTGEDFWALLSLASITELRFPILCYKNTG